MLLHIFINSTGYASISVKLHFFSRKDICQMLKVVDLKFFSNTLAGLNATK